MQGCCETQMISFSSQGNPKTWHIPICVSIQVADATGQALCWVAQLISAQAITDYMPPEADSSRQWTVDSSSSRWCVSHGKQRA